MEKKKRKVRLLILKNDKNRGENIDLNKSVDSLVNIILV